MSCTIQSSFRPPFCCTCLSRPQIRSVKAKAWQTAKSCFLVCPHQEHCFTAHNIALGFMPHRQIYRPSASQSHKRSQETAGQRGEPGLCLEPIPTLLKAFILLCHKSTATNLDYKRSPMPLPHKFR